MKNWVETPFAELLENIVDNRGKTCPVTTSGITLIATNCIKNTALYPSYEKVRYVSQEIYETWFRGHPKPDDIIFVTKGNPGQCCLAPKKIDFCIAQDMVAVRANPKKIYPYFLFSILRSSIIQNRISNMYVGTLIPHFKKGDFKNLNIPVPSFGLQKIIGDIYIILSQKIDILIRQNATLEAMAQAIFKDWFVDFGPVRAKMEGRQPEGMSREIADLFPDRLDGEGKPEGWKWGTLGEYAQLNPESWSKKNYPDEIYYVDLSNTKWGTIESISHYEKEKAPSRAQRVLRIGDTIIGTVRPGNGSFAYIGCNGLTGSTGFAVLRPRKEIYKEFIYCAATDKYNIERISFLADGGAYPAVKPEIVLDTHVCICRESVMKVFSMLLVDIMKKIEENKKQNLNLALIRDTLLPKLISGELRVPDAEKMVADIV